MVYDIIPLTHQDVVEDEGRRLFSKAFGCLIEHVDGLLTISKSVATDVTEYLKKANFHRPELKITHFYLGADFGPTQRVSKDCVRPELAHFLLSQTGPVWLMVGTIEPRKNHHFVLDSFDEIWKENRPDALIIIGRVGWKCGNDNRPYSAPSSVWKEANLP
ncbi:MAG: hypothetical protein IPK68_15330 [Bdellovibrionales bacterium]|nr:hypothetical protein [Bdellovibrionales bacterium]